MQFKLLPIAAAALSVQSAYATSSSQQAQAIVTANDVVNVLGQISGILADGAETLSKPTISNLINGGGKIVADIAGLVASLGAGASDLFDLRSIGTFQRDEQLSICLAYEEFVDSNHRLVDVVADGILGDSIVHGIASSVMTLIENVVEKFATGLIGHVPECKEQAQTGLQTILGDASRSTFDS